MRLPHSLAVALLFTVGSALAQDATGRVVGTVSDPSGGVVPNAKITATNLATSVKQESTSNQDGYYQVLFLPVGQYSITVEAAGFRRLTAQTGRLEINQALRLDLKMELGSTGESVQVEADVTGVETVNATLGGSVTSNTIVSAPLNGRNVLSLALLMPGVVPSNAGGAGLFSIAGGRQDSVSFILDGGTNNNLLNNGVVLNPNPDTVDEFRVLVNNYGAEYGRGGGGVVSVVTKSGTNQYHGSMYDYARNDALNANAFFNNQAGLPRDNLKRQQYGATLGGPVMIPKLINGKDRLFFFLAYQGQKQTQAQTTARFPVFTPAELTGDFSLSNAARTGPDTTVVSYLQKFPYFQPNPALAAKGIIDPTRINSISKKYLDQGLIPSNPAGTSLYQRGAAADADEITAKPEWVISQNDRLTATLGWNRAPGLFPFGAGNAPGFPYTTTVSRYFGSVGYLKTFSPALINDFHFTAQRNNAFQGVPASKLSTGPEMGIKITPDDPTGPPILQLVGNFTAGPNPQGPTKLIDNTYVWEDRLTWTKGRHTIKTGFSYTPYQNNTLYDFYVNGIYVFYGTSGSSFSTNSKADFLMGLPDNFFQAPQAATSIRQHNISWFLQDEYKVRKNLVLTLGMRYEYSSPKIDLQGRTFSLKYGQQSTVFTKAPKGLVFPGDPGVPAGANYPDRNDWSPRFGFAWDPKGNGKTSIRGGFGVFFDVLKAEDNLQFNGQVPFFAAADLYPDPLAKNPTGEPNLMSDPYASVGAVNPFPSRPPAKNIDFAASGFGVGGSGVYFVDPNLRTPYIYQYNLSIQRELFNGFRLETAYVGSSSHKLTGLVDANPVVLGTKSRLYNSQTGVDPSLFSYIDQFSNVGTGHYNGLTAGLTKRMSDVRFMGNLQFQLSYTYSKSIDTASGFRTGASRVAAYNWNQFRGVSNFDLTHFISASGAWELPFAKAWNSGPKRLTGGWTIYPIITYRSGQPLDIGAALSRSATSIGPSGAGDPNLVRVNLINPNVTYFDPRNQVTASTGRVGNFYFDPGAFERASLSTLNSQSNSGAGAVTNAALRTYGTLGRNALRGPDRFNADISIAKITNLVGERVKLEIRGDFFNIFNNVEWNNPNLTSNGSTFGQISTTADPRIIQLAARISF